MGRRQSAAFGSLAVDTDDQIVVMDGNTVTPSNPNNMAEGVINIMRRGSAR